MANQRSYKTFKEEKARLEADKDSWHCGKLDKIQKFGKRGNC